MVAHKTRGPTRKSQTAKSDGPARAAKPGGRPSDYRAEFARQAYHHCLLGATDEQLGDLFEVSKQTINTWKQKHPKFLASIKEGKVHADQQVAASLFKRATGFSHKAVKIFSSEGTSFEHEYEEYYPPDTGAAAFWLKNRQPKNWRDKPEISVVVNNDLQVDLSKPVEEWGQPELEAELRRRGALPSLQQARTNGHREGQ